MTERAKLIKELDALLRVQMRAEYNYCQRCGSKKHQCRFPLEVSHIFGKKAHPRLRWEKDNLLMLCSMCHIWAHQKPAEAWEWFTEKYPVRSVRLEEKRRMAAKLATADLREMKEGLL